ncbi:GerMN domain-containing protein [Actinophytocola glycyrrhizae]|uniref:GerMN domain-containing protein n=1 Tax=Actinophytocola glycyrrhizae TaxID=2044873 RepID=A0ABV9S387_9PSEU
MRRLTAILAAALVVVSGCTSPEPGTEEPSEVPTGSSTSTPTTAAPTTPAHSPTVEPDVVVAGSVYFLRDEKLVPASRDLPGPGVAEAAVRALLAGPSEAEQAAGMSSTVPAGTGLRGVNLADGTVTVDLSGQYASGGGSFSMMGRLAQLVFTLTQFSSVERVELRLDGKPVTALGGEGVIIDRPQTRGDYEDFAPAVLVESPVFGANVTSPLRVYGSANVFEAQFSLRVTDAAGKALVEQPVMATSGTGTRGTFDTTLRFTVAAVGPGKVIAWYASAQDGSEVVVSEIPVNLGS